MMVMIDVIVNGYDNVMVSNNENIIVIYYKHTSSESKMSELLRDFSCDT